MRLVLQEINFTNFRCLDYLLIHAQKGHESRDDWQKIPTFVFKLVSFAAKILSFFMKGYFVYNAYWTRVPDLALFFVYLLRDPIFAW